jgi:arabinogalactan oligomer / maltooligosaccharide transport system substrate-binding protein
MKKRTIAALTVAFTAAIAVSATSPAAGGKIVVWTDLAGPELEWFSQTAANYAKSPAAAGNAIEVVSVEFDAGRDKFIQTAAKGEAADLVATIPHDRIGEYAAAGVLEPMGKYVDTKFKSDVAPSALEAFNYNGKLFGIPMSGEAVAIVYNKKLLPGGVPKTWSEFISTAQKLTKADAQEFGFLAPIGIQYHMYGIYQAMGAYVFGKNKDGSLNSKDVGLGNEGAAKAAQVINDLRFKYKLIPEGAEDGGVIKDLFLKGKVAMMLTGPWDMADVKKAGIDFGIALMPKPDGAVKAWTPFIGIRGLIMNAYSKNKEATANFAKFLVSNQNQIALNKVGGKVPVSKSAVRQLAKDPTVAGFGTAIAAGVPMPNIPAMGQVWGPWGNALGLSIKEANPDFKKLHSEAVQQINAAINK